MSNRRMWAMLLVSGGLAMGAAAYSLTKEHPFHPSARETNQ